VHLLVDSTGLKLCGSGEWLFEKHGTKTRRSWRKLHIAVDADTGQIAAAALTTSDIDDASQVSRWLDQVDSPVASFTADGAVATCRGVRHRATSLERGAERHRANGTDDSRSAPADHRRARPHGLAEGDWLQLANSGRGRYQPL
jgi:hypothetical protein